MRVNPERLALVQGWDDTKATLRAWNARPAAVLLPWAVASVLVAAGLLLAAGLYDLRPVTFAAGAVIVIGLALLLLTPTLAKLRGTAIAQPDSGPQGVPTTGEASYEPVQDPAERRG
jgi:hypothetical protein